MFESEADRDLAILAATDLDLEPLFLNDAPTDDYGRGAVELELVAACERQIAFLHAVQAKALVRFGKHRPGERGQPVSEFAADEIALAAGWTRMYAASRLNLAYTLTHHLPATLAALETGDIDLRRAQKLADLTSPLPPELASQVETNVLPAAAGQNTSQLARATRKTIAKLDPDGDQARHQHRRTERRVALIPDDDAMAELRAILPIDTATRIHDTLTSYARGAATPEDTRTLDQRRADVLCDLILRPPTGGQSSRAGTASEPNGTGVIIQVTVAASTLLGLDDQPGELAGYGPIPAQMARELATDSTWRRLLTDPATGALLDYGRTRYRPPAALAEFVRARDQHCVFPGCSRAATHCDIDHRTRYPDGPTAAANLQCLCRHHHRLKHEAGWTLEYHHGTYTWTTPTGQQYTHRPPPIAEPATPPHPTPPHDRAGDPAAPDPPDDPPPF